MGTWGLEIAANEWLAPNCGIVDLWMLMLGR